ncbi:MAG: hypothetical protein J5622_01940 [Firmicutes bacterium]|nr:hypothetical protein [Bacillota bacterium]
MKKERSLDEIKAAFKAYDERKEKFGLEHKPCKCRYCGRKIHPGSEIWVADGYVYCSSDCGFYGMDGAHIEFDDDEYADFFEKAGE